jgi:hypothetical protein
MAAIVTAWSLLGSPRDGQAALGLKNIYSLGSSFTASIIADVFETDVKGLVARAQCFPYYQLVSSPPRHN